MFELKFRIDTDGDFGYTKSNYELNEYEENTCYFDCKEDAFNALGVILKGVYESFSTSKGYMSDIKDSFKDMLDELEYVDLESTNCYEIDRDFGNPSCYFYIRECEKVKIGNGFAIRYIADCD